MERFVIRENIDRYRRMLDEASDEVTRRQILRLLKEEEEKLANVTKPGDRTP
ncbi:MAG TPA: hypothetical protein VG986_04450 [Pseudolabrys sp.]|nr:hypothetical protein [Pseudolabrys sp.]